MVQWLVERLVLSGSSEMMCWYSWLILAVWPAMVVVGTLTQCCITSTGMYHTQLNTSGNSRHVSLQRIRSREARAEVRQKKYRYLYQVRTAHGDIISQEYIQSLQRKAYPATSDNGTLQSDSTHTTMLPPDHTPLAPLTESEDEGADTFCSRKGVAGEHQRGSINVHQQAQYQLHYPAQRPQLSQYSINCSKDSGGGYSITGCSRGCSSQPHCSNTTATCSSDCYNSSPSPDDHCSELLYTPSPHSSSPDNGRRSCINRPEQRYSSSQNTPSPSPPRPHCVPR